MIITSFLARMLLVTLGQLHPAYSTFKAIRNRNVREQLKLQMYWIHFSCFNLVEPFLDFFLFWLPFYDEIKFIYILWNIPVSPVSHGGIFAYKKLIHPVLISNEKIIDEYIEKAKNYSLQNTTMLLKILLKASSKILVRFMDDGQVYVRYFFKRKFEMTDIRKSDCLVKEEKHRNDNPKLKNKINAVRIVEQGLEDAFEKNKF